MTETSQFIAICAACGEPKPVHLTVVSNGHRRYFCAECISLDERTVREAVFHLSDAFKERQAKALLAMFDRAAFQSWRQN